MKSKLRSTARQLRRRRKTLLGTYDAEALHQLRINIRRLRGYLERDPREEARQLRRAWKKLVQETNDARDWDTFRAWLEVPEFSADYALLLPLIESYQTAAHERVMHMLESPAWSSALETWESFLDHSGAKLSAGPAPKVRSLSRKFLRAQDKALESGGVRDWHKLRIATKNLRYALDELHSGGSHSADGAAKARKLCKRLQTDLGNWHDTVIHGGLLQTLLSQESCSAGAEEAILRLVAHLSREGQCHLQYAVDRILRHGKHIRKLASAG